MNYLAGIGRGNRLDAVIDTNPFARAVLGWLKDRARSLDVCRKEWKGLGYLTSRFIKAATRLLIVTSISDKTVTYVAGQICYLGRRPVNP